MQTQYWTGYANSVGADSSSSRNPAQLDVAETYIHAKCSK